MKVLIVKISGGLGNQLFTFSTARRLAFVNNAILVIDNVSGFKNDQEYNRSYMLNYFNHPFRVANIIERIPNNRFIHKFLSIFNKIFQFENRFLITQEDINFDKRLVNLKLKYKYTYIEDLWQSENYFSDIDSILRKDLLIRIKLTQECEVLYQNILNNNSVAVHVRFFQNSLNSSFTLDESYYLNAIEKINNNITNPKFYFFSDKPELLNELLENVNKNHCVLINLQNTKKDKDIFEFYLMKNCKHHIIANSTFSWWAAWLGDNKNQMVISPNFKSLTGICGWGFNGLIPEKWDII